MWFVVPCLLVASVASAKPRRAKRVKAPVIEEPAEVDDVATVEEPDEEPVEEPDEEPDEQIVETVKPRRKNRPTTEIYFRAGIAHVEPRISSGGLELQPEGITKLATPMEPVQGGIETDATNTFAAIIGVAPAM